MNKQLFAKLALIALAAGAAAAHAATATSTFQVQMTITSSCAVTTAPTTPRAIAPSSRGRLDMPRSVLSLPPGRPDAVRLVRATV